MNSQQLEEEMIHLMNERNSRQFDLEEEKNELIKRSENIQIELLELNEKLRVVRAHNYMADNYDSNKDTIYIIESNLCKKICKQYCTNYKLLTGPTDFVNIYAEKETKYDKIVIKGIEFDSYIEIEIDGNHYNNITTFIEDNGSTDLRDDYDNNYNFMFSNYYSDVLIMDDETINYPKYVNKIYQKQLLEHDWRHGPYRNVIGYCFTIDISKQ